MIGDHTDLFSGYMNGDPAQDKRIKELNDMQER